MSRMPLPLARARAGNVKGRLEDLVERIEVVGSIRRRRDWVGDIELLAEPLTREEPDLFHPEQVPDLEPVVNRLGDLGSIVKSGPRYVQVKLGYLQAFSDATVGHEACQLDLFLCHPPASWGALKVIRTGPSDFSQICVTRLRKKGWRCWRGAVWRKTGGEPAARGEEPSGDLEGDWERVPTPTEKDFFDACDMDGVPPHQRDEVVDRLRNLRQRRPT